MRNMSEAHKSATTDAAPAQAYVRISWSWLAITSITMMLVALGTLVLVATMKDVDALSTIALALAVLSFVIQIGLFVADAWQRSQTETRASQVNIETKSLLSEMKETSRATNELVNRQFDTVLRSLIEATERTVGTAKGLDPDLRDKLDRELRAVVSGAPKPTTPELSAADQAVLADYERPLSEGEIEQAERALSKISAPSYGGLLSMADDDVAARISGGHPGLFESLFRGADELTDAGLVVPSDPPETYASNGQYTGEKYFLLSDEGRLAARYIRGPKAHRTSRFRVIAPRTKREPKKSPRP